MHRPLPVPLLPLLVLLWPLTHGTDCGSAPNCTLGHRSACSADGLFPGTCGPCLEGAHGIPGESNSACLAPRSCAAIFPGQTLCTPADRTARAPFIVPFNRCACDDGTGLMWPTAPGQCAKLVVSLSGLYTLSKCKSRTCDPVSCSVLTEWYPARIGSRPTFECRRRGSDALRLSDSCSFDDVGRFTEPSLCGHPGLTAHRVVEAQNHAVNCELAPKCPGSVLGTRLQESCCAGTLLSRTVSGGFQGDGAAQGFCSSGLAAGEVCAVATVGPGWQGCACLNSDGHARPGRQCTIECVPPDCELPVDGIPRTPEAWITSNVPGYFFPVNRIGMAGEARRPWALPALAAVLACALGP